MKITKKSLAANIIKKRNALNISQSKLAEASDISLRMVQHLEAGKHWPSTEILIKLSVALNISVSELLGEREDSKKPYNPHYEPNILKPSAQDIIEFNQRLMNMTDLRRGILMAIAFENSELLAQIDDSLDPKTREIIKAFVG